MSSKYVIRWKNIWLNTSGEWTSTERKCAWAKVYELRKTSGVIAIELYARIDP